MAARSVDVVVHTQALIGESPVWDGTGVLWWVDVLRGEVHCTDVGTGVDRLLRLGTSVGAVAMRRSGGLVAAAADGFAVLGAGVGAPSADVVVPGVSGGAGLQWLWRAGTMDIGACGPSGLVLRMNDAKCDAAGRLWGGTMTVDRRPGACFLYCVEPAGTVTAVLDGVTLSNGLGWSPDGRTFYYIDTPRRQVEAFDFDVETGTLRRRRELVRIEDGAGNPDGMAVDADGCLWVALAHGSAVRRYTPAGRLDAVVDLPVRKVTSCTFGGPGLEVLFVTSACVGMSEQELVAEPFAGALLACDVGVAGLPANRFGG